MTAGAKVAKLSTQGLSCCIGFRARCSKDAQREELEDSRL